ncbi:MAG: hypothetical protein PHN61_13145 [Methanothrix sp.]|nr:hypothetical protein [Methanothrix sp.]
MSKNKNLPQIRSKAGRWQLTPGCPSSCIDLEFPYLDAAVAVVASSKGLRLTRMHTSASRHKRTVSGVSGPAWESHERER